MPKPPKHVVAPEVDRDPALGIDADGGPAALPRSRDILPQAEEDERGSEASAEDWLSDPAEPETYQLARSDIPSEGFVVVAVPRPADRSLPDERSTRREIFDTEEAAQAEADQRNNKLNLSTTMNR